MSAQFYITSALYKLVLCQDLDLHTAG